MTKIRIVLADDHAVVREGLKTLVHAQDDMEVVGECADGITAVQKVMELKPDVAVLDISMPGLNGAKAAREILKISPRTKVVALTVHEDRSYLRELLEAGAAAYILKRSAADELIRALRVVAGGELYLDSSLAGKVVASLAGRTTDANGNSRADLSDRETDVVRLIAQGYSNKEIASQLAVSIKSVETYKMRSMEKLGLRSRTDFIRFALRNGWLDAL
ncbi:MAG TPA: response regulator transcription factor [Candidatus Saccharimonadales bacterium]|nr:response regulator transcription factor [Candidatus Saccharimonadales bacterium]